MYENLLVVHVRVCTPSRASEWHVACVIKKTLRIDFMHKYEVYPKSKIPSGFWFGDVLGPWMRSTRQLQHHYDIWLILVLVMFLTAG